MRTYKIEAWFRYDFNEKDFLVEYIEADNRDEAYLIFMCKPGPVFFKVEVEEFSK
tara:strand:+ start:176 stop:340 length:165 start_codon:yes stop_codon:yes gene_type:complete